jgi:hypothetical protein
VNRDEYLRALQSLPTTLRCPTVEQLQAICPHLTQEQVAAIFGKQCVEFALPSGLVRHSALIGCYMPENAIESAPPRFWIDKHIRTDQSYADGPPHGRTFTGYRHMQRAMWYAEAHWSKNLILDSWGLCLEIYLVGDNPDYPGYLMAEAQVTLGLHRHAFAMSDASTAPYGQQLDEATVVATANTALGKEIREGHTVLASYNCASCGGGLDRSHCLGCGKKYRDNLVPHVTRHALSPKLIELLRAEGHSFPMLQHQPN